MLKFILLVLFILFIVWLEEMNYRVVHQTVKRRRADGDLLCGARKRWGIWRVVEYGDNNQ